ncbi:PIN domain-containing protein [Bordetella genomosp. 11]|uniref:PIN domain-containing protein n=1 Tax=Bordetella genomosp. 11 TaxID=1416808 RepID=A0A261UNR3_9BORD|nr:PIN domain-containing protein [Bordetella genomosp. 11]OZI63516.1 PIN domain-containing protein [Bordetella genomosp. 11]
MPSTVQVPPSPPLVVLDACVLMSSILRPLLLRLAAEGVFAPVWSARIGEEWIRNAARLWKVTVDDVAALWEAMQQQFPDADAGDVLPYETGLRYSDPKDHHVIAAGLAKRARCGLQQPPTVLVMTWNLKDFNRSEMRRLGVDAFNPDRLLSQWWGQSRTAIRMALHSVATDAAALGREAQPLTTTLHRERLYRLRALVAQDEAEATRGTPGPTASTTHAG